jgi:hypothetical protein
MSDKISKGERMVLISGAALFILSFIKPWAKLDLGGAGQLLGGISASFSAWDYGFFPLKLALILSLIGVGLVIAKLAGASPNVPPTTHAALGGLTLVLILLQVLIGPPDAGIVDVVDRGIMLFIALIPAAAQAYGGYLVLQEAGEAGMKATPPPPAV